MPDILNHLRLREIDGTATLGELAAIDEIERLESECFKLAAGVCEYRGGNDHGNPLCLKTNKLIQGERFMRDKFEQWACDYVKVYAFADGRYDSPYTQAAWEAWQAAWAFVSAKADIEMERVKACEHIADGDEGWEGLEHLCPSTAAVGRLRRELARIKEIANTLASDGGRPG